MERDAGPFLSFTAADLAAAVYLIVTYAAITWIVRRGWRGRRSTGDMVSEYRRLWMRRAALRNMLVADVALLTSLKSGAAFLASGVMFAIGGAIAMLGQIERMEDVASHVMGGLSGGRGAQEAKILILIAILAYAFLRLIWSIRVFGYCAVVMGAIPDPETATPEEVEREALRAAEINRLAARSFNDGLRALYFALATLAWLLGPLAFAAAITLTSLMLLRREFASDTRDALRFGSFRG